MQKIVYFNATMDRAAGEALKSGVVQAWKSHPRAAEFMIHSIDFFYGQKKSPRDMSTLVRELGASGVILSGSEKNTSEVNDPWVRDYISGVRNLLNLDSGPEDSWLGPNLPIFGICFGHQALACALGGETSRFSYREGFVTVQPRRQASNHPVFSKIFGGQVRSLKLAVTHGDHVVRLPPGLHLLATSDYCHCQAFAHDQWPVLAVQSHPEITEEIRKVPGEEEWLKVSDSEYKTQEGPNLLRSVFDWMLERSR